MLSVKNFKDANQDYDSLSSLDELCAEGLLTQKDTDIIFKWKSSINS